MTTPEHPSVQPWTKLKGLLDPGIARLGELPPEATLKEHLRMRRQAAQVVAKAAHAVIDAIDQNPA